jgi:hypothetical protein
MTAGPLHYHQGRTLQSEIVHVGPPTLTISKPLPANSFMQCHDRIDGMQFSDAVILITYQRCPIVSM